jgi:hypothetical protein
MRERLVMTITWSRYETHLIFHFARVVLDDESIFLALRLLIERIFLMNVVELVQEILVAAAGEAENFIKIMTIIDNFSRSNSLARIIQDAQQPCWL